MEDSKLQELCKDFPALLKTDLIFKDFFTGNPGNIIQYESVIPLFGAAYTAPNKGTRILY